jgi:hypothetical protein
MKILWIKVCRVQCCYEFHSLKNTSFILTLQLKLDVSNIYIYQIDIIITLHCDTLLFIE